MAVSGGGDRPVLAARSGLIDVADAAQRCGDAGALGGGMASPSPGLLLHSDQGCQFTGGEWQRFPEGSPDDLQHEPPRKRPRQRRGRELLPVAQAGASEAEDYSARDHARADVFDYIELFYNPVRRHGNNQGLSPVAFEKQSL